MDWVTGDDVAQRLRTLGRTPDDTERLDASAATACQLVRKRRGRSDDTELALDPAVIEGTLRWACLLYQAPTQPSGFATFEDPGADSMYGDVVREIYPMVGYDPVLA
jgi:hypothetical protein